MQARNRDREEKCASVAHERKAAAAFHGVLHGLIVKERKILEANQQPRGISFVQLVIKDGMKCQSAAEADDQDDSELNPRRQRRSRSLRQKNGGEGNAQNKKSALKVRQCHPEDRQREPECN